MKAVPESHSVNRTSKRNHSPSPGPDAGKDTFFPGQAKSSPFFGMGEKSFFTEEGIPAKIQRQNQPTGAGAAATAGAQAGAAVAVSPAQLAPLVTASLTQSPPVFIGGPTPVLPQGGAFQILQSLNANQLIGTLELISVGHRLLLFNNVHQISDGFQQLRIKSAIRSVSWGQSASGIERLNLMEQLRTAFYLDIFRFLAALFGMTGINPNNAVLVSLFNQFQGLSRLQITTLLQTLDRPFHEYLRNNVNQAPAADRQRMTNILDDFLGTPAMAAEDYIDVNPLRGLRRTMAMVYNTKGQFIADRARQYNADSGVLAGFMQVESGSQAFSNVQDRPLIRFEVHVFWRLWGRSHRAQFNQHFRFNQTGNAWTGHQFRINNTSPWQNFHGNQNREWQAVNIAETISNQETAYRSMSIGMGQIMGFNHNNAGFATAVDMFDAFNRSERAQMDGILNFINANPRLLRAVQNRNFNNIARYYNGAGQVGVYGPRIRAATQAYDRVTRGKRHVFP